MSSRLALALALAAAACSSESETNGGSTSSSSSGGAAEDAGPPAFTTDGGSGDDAGPRGDTTSIGCGGASCALPSEHCCLYNLDRPPPVFAFACATGSGCPRIASASDVVVLGCVSGASCPAGSVCCIANDGTTTNVASCVPAADCKDEGERIIRAQLCDPNAMPTGCPATAACSTQNVDQWNLPSGYATCGGKGF